MLVVMVVGMAEVCFVGAALEAWAWNATSNLVV